jgi:Family of unknown function (DUF6641)
MAAILQKLKLSEKTRAEQRGAPEVRARKKMVDAIDEQIAAAEAELSGQHFMKRGLRYVQDTDTGERVKREVPLRFRRWWWQAPDGTLLLDVRYGNRRLEIKPKKAAIEVGSKDNLVATLNTLKEAVEAGELDQVLMAAREERVGKFRRATS